MSTESAIAREGDGEFGSSGGRLLMLGFRAGMTERRHEMRYNASDWLNCMPVSSGCPARYCPAGIRRPLAGWSSRIASTPFPVAT